MTTLNNLYHQLDRLDREELQQVRRYIDQRIEQSEIANEDAQAKVKALQAAFAEIRAGMGKDELEEMIEAMNSEYIEPFKLSEYNWILKDDEDKAP